jgi:hypothetical protein
MVSGGKPPNAVNGVLPEVTTPPWPSSIRSAMLELVLDAVRSSPEIAGVTSPTPDVGMRGSGMDERSAKISELLHEAAETHHRVFRITDGADDDWASWYA